MRPIFFYPIVKKLNEMSASLFAALKVKSRAESHKLPSQDDDVVWFQKIPDMVRQEDVEVGVLLNK
jgi:hypothetical protein